MTSASSAGLGHALQGANPRMLSTKKHAAALLQPESEPSKGIRVLTRALSGLVPGLRLSQPWLVLRERRPL